MSHKQNLHSQEGGVYIVSQAPGFGITLAYGDTVPASGSTGFNKGCLFIQTDGTNEATVLYTNAAGTITSSSFAAIDLNVTELALLSGLTAEAAELNIMDGVLATTAEINRAADVSTRIVSLAVSTSITELLHDNKTIVMSGAGMARTFTLPAATGSGAKFKFVVGEVNTSNYVIKSVVGTDLMEGGIFGCDGGGVTAPLIWAAGATDDTITLNGTTSGGVSIGDWIELQDISATGWHVNGVVTQSGMEITPFSDSVA